LGGVYVEAVLIPLEEIVDELTRLRSVGQVGFEGCQLLVLPDSTKVTVLEEARTHPLVALLGSAFSSQDVDVRVEG